MFVYTNPTEDFTDELLPENNEDIESFDVSVPGMQNRNIKRDALFVNILMDFMDKFYVSKKIDSKRSQDEEVIVRDKTDD